MFWYPVAMGAATREEVYSANMEQLQVYNEIADRIRKLKYGQGGTDVE